MKMKKSYTMILMAALMLNLVLSGCATKNTGGSNDKNVPAGSSKIANKPLELSIHMHVWNNTIYNDEFPVFKKAQEITNVALKGSASRTATDSKQLFNIMMASGAQADIVDYYKGDIEKYANEGAFIALNELIEKYAPNIKAFMEKNAEARKYMYASDGKIYMIPNFMDGQVAKGWMIRKDWLDKLGLGIPKTIDEYYNVLKAFKERDPNGNGKKDEIPFFTRDSIVAAGELLSLFGVEGSWSAKAGKVHYGAYTPEYKNAMAKIADWYSQDLIDKEVFTRGDNARDQLLGNDVGGSTHDWFTSTTSYNTKLKEKFPGFEFIPIAPPADVNGKVWEQTSRGLTSDVGWAITKNNQHPVETIKYFDFWFSEEGRRLMNFGIEGQQYEMVDGKPKFKEEILNGKKPPVVLLHDIGAQLPVGFQQDFSYEEQIMDPIAREGVKMYMDNKYCIDQFPKVTLTPEEKSAFDDKWPAISTYIRETTQRWVLGGEPVEGNFENYIAKLKSMGMDEMITIYQNAYDRYQKQ